jgi:hypothetical protein
MLHCEYLPTQDTCAHILCLKSFHNPCTTCPADQQNTHFLPLYNTVVTYIPQVLTFSNSTFYPHSVFVWIWEQTAIISLYRINWLVCITETGCVYCAVRTGCLYTASLTFSNSTFCPHRVFTCFVWIWEQTAIISLYSINWLVFIAESESVYCAVRTGYYE